MSRRSEWKIRSKPTSPVAVEYLAKGFSGKGNLLDISEEGLKVEGSHGVHTGEQLTLRINAPESGISIHIARAHVRWEKGKMFGVKFDSLDPTVKTQLLAFLATLTAPVSAPSPQ